jgi:hypothetical protein
MLVRTRRRSTDLLGFIILVCSFIDMCAAPLERHVRPRPCFGEWERLHTETRHPAAHAN